MKELSPATSHGMRFPPIELHHVNAGYDHQHGVAADNGVINCVGGLHLSSYTSLVPKMKGKNK